MPDETLRETLTAAFQQHSAEPAAEAPAVADTPSVEPSAPSAPYETAAPATETASEAAQRARDGKGRFAPKGAETKPAAAVGAKAALQPAGTGTTPSKNPAPAGPVVASAALPTAPELRPPQSWKPAVREKWSSLPREVQEEALRIDREVRQTLQETSGVRRFQQEFQQVVSPFEGLIRAHGVEPMQAVQGALQTFAALSMGAPQQKAQVLANLFERAGIPIELLADALDGKLKQAPQGVDPMRMRQEIEQGIFQRLQQQKAQITQQRLRQELSDFEATQPEFFEDPAIQARMGAILDSDEKASIQDAYAQACWSLDHTRKVLQQREAAKAATNAQASTQRSMAAASSVKSQPAAPMNGAKPTTLRDQIKAAMTR